MGSNPILSAIAPRSLPRLSRLAGSLFDPRLAYKISHYRLDPWRIAVVRMEFIEDRNCILSLTFLILR
jgi:hypothetical protein